MNPYMIESLAAAHVRDLRRQATVARRVRKARRARRGGSAERPSGI